MYVFISTAGRLKQDLKQAQSSMAGLESERKKWLSQLELENSQLKQLFDDAKRAKEQLVLVCSLSFIDVWIVNCVCRSAFDGMLS